MKSVYLDYAASTPVDPRVIKAMKPYETEYYANPGSLTRTAQKASAAIFDARRSILKSFNNEDGGVVFTSGATEANNLALRGVIKKAGIKNPRIIVSSIEHSSILKTAEDLKADGVDVVIVPVNKEGVVDLKKITAAINKKTVLVSIGYVNNEVGTIQLLSKIADAIKKNKEGIYPLFHTDATQAVQYLTRDMNELGVDLLTYSGHKIYSTKGIGALLYKDEEALAPILTGGDQENGLRAGTENVAGVVGLKVATEIAEKMRSKEGKRVAALCKVAVKEIKKVFKNAKLNGSVKNRIPNNINIYIPSYSAHELLVGLDLEGVAVATGSACTARVTSPSYVIEALGYNENRATKSLRITLGRQTTKQDIKRLVTVLKKLKQVL